MITPDVIKSRVQAWLDPAQGAVTIVLIGVIVVCVVALASRNNALRTAVATWTLLP